MKNMFVLGRKNEVLVQREDGTFFTLSAQSMDELLVLVAMWQQPIENWNGSFNTFEELEFHGSQTVSIKLTK